MPGVHSRSPLANVCVGLFYTYHRDGRMRVGKLPNLPSLTLLVRESGGPADTLTVPLSVPLLQTHTPLRPYLALEAQPIRGTPALLEVLLTTRETRQV